MIIGLQIIALIFAFSMIYIAVLHFKRKEISRTEITSWLVMWTAAIVVIIFPEILRSFASTFLVTRVFDLMVIGGFILVIIMVASAYLRTKKLEKRLEDLVRREAIKNKGKK
jgi:hypothetical protein